MGLAAAAPLEAVVCIGGRFRCQFYFGTWPFCGWRFGWDRQPRELRPYFPDSPALAAGLQPNDIFLEIDGVRVDSARVMADQLHHADGRSLDILVQRGSGRVLIHTQTNTQAVAVAEGGYVLGVEVEQTTAHGYLRRSPQEAAVEATAYVRQLVSSTIAAPGQLARGELSAEEARPVSVVGISQIAGRATANTFITGSLFPVLLMMGLLSTALGFTQLLPIPALDGGRIIFVLIELVSGRRVPPERETAVHRTGIIVLLALMVILIAQDLLVPILP